MLWKPRCHIFLSSTAKKPRDVGMFPLNITGVLMFILLEAVLEKCYTILRGFFFPSELCRS